MSRTIAHKPNASTRLGKKKKNANSLGLCMCKQCKIGRRGTRDGLVIKIKRSIRRWWSNRPEKYGAYTD